jgi:hypothetical protein
MNGCARSLGAARYPGDGCGATDGCCSVRGRVIVTGGYHRGDAIALSFGVGDAGAARRGTADAGRPPSVRVSGTYRFTPGWSLVAGGAAKLERVRAPAAGALVAGAAWLRKVARPVPSSGWFGAIAGATPGTVVG